MDDFNVFGNDKETIIPQLLSAIAVELIVNNDNTTKVMELLPKNNLVDNVSINNNSRYLSATIDG